MHANSSNETRALWARGFMAVWLALTMALALSTWPAEAAPFVYVTNHANNVSVIDTATNNVVATVPVGSLPAGVAVIPDGKHAYVANEGSATVSVISTATNTVVATVGVEMPPLGSPSLRTESTST